MESLALPSSTEMKTFWSRPEGKTAMIVLAALVGGCILEGTAILSFIVSMLTDTLHIALLGGMLAALAYLTFGKKPRLVYRVIMRSITGVFVSVYPIEIIQDKLVQMKKRRDKMNDQIGEVRGSITLLQRTIDSNHQTAVKGYSMAQQAQKMAGAAHDETEALRMKLQVQANARKAQRRENANIGYTNLMVKLQKIYDFLTRYAAHIDFFIDDTSDEIDQKKIEYKTTNTAFGAMKTAMKVIKGNATEEDIYDQAMEFIEADVSKKLGIMDDLQRVSQNFMDGLDVQEGAVDDQALQALNAYEQKLLTSGDSELAVMTNVKANAEKLVPIPISTPKSSVASGGYDDLIG